MARGIFVPSAVTRSGLDSGKEPGRSSERTVKIRGMKYSLRSLMIVVLVLPPLLAVVWAWVESAIASVERAEDSFSPGPPG